nr:MAG TPA: hypothetical protein [Crassvirales sp.]
MGIWLVIKSSIILFLIFICFNFNKILTFLYTYN